MDILTIKIRFLWDKLLSPGWNPDYMEIRLIYAPAPNLGPL